jgi:hypothetical protein
MGACFRSVSYCEIRKVSRETRSRSYAKCFLLNVLVSRFNFSDGVRLGGMLPRGNTGFTGFTARDSLALRCCGPRTGWWEPEERTGGYGQDHAKGKRNR